MSDDQAHICPPDHKHGATATCYTQHACRCDECRVEHRERMFYFRAMTAAGHGDRFNQLVDATGSARRVQALMALGWAQERLARLNPATSQDLLSTVLRSALVRRDTVAKVAELYERFSTSVPPAHDRATRISVSRTKLLAARRGYVPPLAWDDIDTDPHPPAPTGEPIVDVVAIELTVEGHRPSELTRDERHEVLRQLNARHWSDGMIAAACGVSTKTIQRDRDELGIPAAVGADQQPIIREATAA